MSKGKIEVRSAAEPTVKSGPVLDMQAMIAQAVAAAVANLVNAAPASAPATAPTARVKASKASKPAPSPKRAASRVFDESKVEASVERWDKDDGSHEFSVSVSYDGRKLLRFAGFKAQIFASDVVQSALADCIEQNEARGDE